MKHRIKVKQIGPDGFKFWVVFNGDIEVELCFYYNNYINMGISDL